MDNIKVAIRVRSLIAREVNAGAKVRWIIQDNTIYQDDPECKDARFVFDSISDHRKSNLEVFNEVARPIVAGVMQGINGSVFAYGQTSSGKTYTMLGDSQAAGIIPLAIQEIFETIENTPDREFLLRVSYMEIYNEEIQDLLTGAKNLKIRETADKEVYVGDLKEQLVTDAQQIYTLMRQGEQRRHIGATNMNEHSSRSHTIFRVIVESRQRMCTGEESDLAVNVSHMNLVDLAGSERTNQTGATGDRFKEGCAINKSLFTLGYVICKLSEGENHVPFRDSKLTRILQNSLGGNSRTAIICTVTPAAIDETISTLKFASRAKNIRNRPTVNEVLSDEALLRRYRMQIQELQKQLEQSCSTTSFDSNHPDVAALEQQLAEKSRKESELRSLVEKLTQMICVSHSDSRSEQSSQAAGLVKKDKRRETWCPGKQPARWNVLDDVGANFPTRRALQSRAGDDFSFVQSPEDMLNAAERCRIAEMEASEPAALPSSLLPNPSVATVPALAPEPASRLAAANVSIQADIDNLLVQELEKQVSVLHEENTLLKALMDELECDIKGRHEKDVANLQQALQAAEWQRDELQKEVSSLQREKSERWDTTVAPASPRAADAQLLDEALQLTLLHAQVHDTGRLLETKLEENARLAGQVDMLVEEKARLDEELVALQQRLSERESNSLWAFEALESFTEHIDDREAELSDLRSKLHNRSSRGLVTLDVQTTPSLLRADSAKAAAAERTPVTPRTRLNNSAVLASATATKRENKILFDGMLAAKSRLEGLLDGALQLNDELAARQDAANSCITSLEGECGRLQAELDAANKHRDDLLAQICDDRKTADGISVELGARVASLEKESDSLRRELEAITQDRDRLSAAAQAISRSEAVSTAEAAAAVPAKVMQTNDFTLLDSSCFEMTTYMDVVREQQSQCKIPSLYDELRSASGAFSVSPRPSTESLALDQDTPARQAVDSAALSQELDRTKAVVADLESERDLLKAAILALEKQLHSESVKPTTVDSQTSPCRPAGSSPLPGDRTAASPFAAAAATPTPAVAVVRPQCHAISDSPILTERHGSTDRNSTVAYPESHQRDLSLETHISVGAFDPSTPPSTPPTRAAILEASLTSPTRAAVLDASLTSPTRAAFLDASLTGTNLPMAAERRHSDDRLHVNEHLPLGPRPSAGLSPDAAEESIDEGAPICHLDDHCNQQTVDSKNDRAIKEDSVRMSSSEGAADVVQPSEMDAASKESEEMQGAASERLAAAEAEAATLRAALDDQLRIEESYMEAMADLRKGLDDVAAKLAFAEEENRRLRGSAHSEPASIKERRASCQDSSCSILAEEDCPTAEAVAAAAAVLTARGRAEPSSAPADELVTGHAAAVGDLTTRLSASENENAKLRSELDARSLETEKLNHYLSAAECRATDYAIAAESLRSEIKEQHDRSADLVEKLAVLTAQIVEMKSKLEASESIINEFQCALRSEKTDKLHIQETNELMTQQMVEMKSKLEASESITNELQSALRSEITDKLHIQETNELMTKQMGMSASKLTMLESENDHLKSHIDGLNDEMDKLKSHIDGMNDEMEKLKSELSSVALLLTESHANAEFMSLDFKEQLKHECERASGLSNQVDLLSEQLAASDRRLRLAEAESADLRAITAEQQREVGELHTRVAQLEDCVAHEQALRWQDQKRADEALKSKDAELSSAQANYRRDIADKMAELGRKELKLQSIEREHKEQLRKVVDHHQRISASAIPADTSRSTCDTSATLAASDDSAIAALKETRDRAVQQAIQLRKEKDLVEAKLRQLEQQQPATAEERWQALVGERDSQIERLRAEVQHVTRRCKDANGELDEERARGKELQLAAAALREQLGMIEREHEEQLRKAADSSLRNSSSSGCAAAATPASSSRTGDGSESAVAASDRGATVTRAKYEYVVQKAIEYRKENKQLAEKMKELQLKVEAPSEHWQALIEEKDDQIERLEAEVQRVMRCCEEADNELDDEKAQHDALKAVVAELREQLSHSGGGSNSAATQQAAADSHSHGSLRTENFELQLRVEQLEKDLTDLATPLRQQIAELSKEAASLRERCTFYKNEARRLLTSQHDVTVGMKTQANTATQCDLIADRLRPPSTTLQSAAGLSTWNPSLPLQPPGCGIVEELERDRLKQEVQQLRRQLKQAQAVHPSTQPTLAQVPQQQHSKPVGAVATGPTNVRPATAATELKPSIVTPLAAGSGKLVAAPAKSSADVQPPRPALSGITNSPKKALPGKAKFFPEVDKLGSPRGVVRGPTISSGQPQPAAADDDNITGCKQQ